MKDRFSLHIHNGQADILEAITVLRNGGTASQSGLVGITNIQYQPTSSAMPSAILPETIFNVQSSGSCDIRFSSHDFISRSTIQLLSNGNSLASGFQVSYTPLGDNASLNTDDNIPSFSYSTSNPVVDFDLIRPSGGSGVKIGFLSVSEQGYVGIGTTSHKMPDGSQSNLFSLNDPLTISHSGLANSGTIAIREQNSTPSSKSDFGKLYVKPKITGDQTQSLFFLDDGGTEFDIIKSRFDYFDGTLYGDVYGNTFGGWYSPHDRSEKSDRLWNTIVGHAAGSLLTDGDSNTILGYFAGSGINSNKSNTVIGATSYTHARQGEGNVILGFKNASPADLSSDIVQDNFSRSIIIGTGLYVGESPDDDTLAIGYGSTPLVLGKLGSSARFFSVKSTPSADALLSVDGKDLVFGFTNTLENDYYNTDDRRHSLITIQDTLSELDSESMLSLRFSNQDNVSKTLVDFEPSGTITSTASFTEPTFRTPYMAVSGDIRCLGALRFSDGSVISTAANVDILAATGIAKVTGTADGNHYFRLRYFDTLSDATSLVSGPLDTSTATLALEVYDSTDTAYRVGKITMDSFTNYLASGYAAAAENCNMIFTDNKYTFDTTRNSRSVVIGCDTASYATGWKNSVMIGNQAGYAATIANTALETDTSCVFIGDKAGYDADNADNSVFLGSSAGKNADAAENSIFIGNSAGLNSTTSFSIGIGDFALAGFDDSDAIEAGTRNIEIVAGKLNNQRLMYELGNLNDRLNIQNSIAGFTEHRFISIGDARLAPECPLEARRNETITGHNTTPDIQAWYNDNSRIGRFNASGDLVSTIMPSGYEASGNRMTSEAWFGNIEGFMVDYVYAPASYDTPTSGLMTVKDSTFTSAEQIMIVNRDTQLSIHGAGATGGAAYVIASRVNGEFRPIYVSCSGT